MVPGPRAVPGIVGTVTDRTSASRSNLGASHPLAPTLGDGRNANGHGADPEPEVDGRRARGVRNRVAVVDAILGLLGDGVTSPTAQEIADRAGVSLRSVFRHFDDLDTLFLAAIERQAQLTANLYVPPSTVGDLDDRISALVRCRRRLYERIFPVRRGWMQRYYDHPRVAGILDEVYLGLHRQIEDLFAADVAGLDAGARRDLIDAVDVLTSFDTWAHLRANRNLGATRAANLVQSMIRAQFDLAGVPVGSVGVP